MSGNPAGEHEITRWKNTVENIDPKTKRAGDPALFHDIILLPVGLADLMWGTLLRFETAVNREFAGEAPEKRPHR
jgi:hypothetical protein